MQKCAQIANFECSNIVIAFRYVCNINALGRNCSQCYFFITMYIMMSNRHADCFLAVLDNAIEWLESCKEFIRKIQQLMQLNLPLVAHSTVYMQL